MYWLAKFIYFKILGWKVLGNTNFSKDTVKKSIIIAVPHTSWHDFYIGVLLRKIADVKTKKKSHEIDIASLKNEEGYESFLLKIVMPAGQAVHKLKDFPTQFLADLYFLGPAFTRDTQELRRLKNHGVYQLVFLITKNTCQ